MSISETHVPSARELIAAFNRAWAAGDIDALMAVMADDPVYRASTGAGPGVDYVGAEEVRTGFERIIAAEAAAGAPPPQPTEIIVEGDRAVSFWSYSTLGPGAQPAVVEGVDVWTVENGRLARKDAYRKAFD